MRLSSPLCFPVNNLRTVSDTKRDFYTHHTRPINSIYRRVVEELMVEMHLLSVNVDFNYHPIYALGVVTSFERFMQGYRPERDKDSIFDAICKAVEKDSQTYKQDAERLKALAGRFSGKDLIAWIASPTAMDGAGELPDQMREIANNPNFKYSRLFAIGLYTLLELSDPGLVKDEKQRIDALNQVSQALHLPADKLQKDLDLYRSNLEKMAQVQIAMKDALEADRKKREKRDQEKLAVTSQAPANTKEEGTSG
ncbi:MAG: photosystem II biogenesis protein Psp29 [Crinalium sp.]